MNIRQQLAGWLRGKPRHPWFVVATVVAFLLYLLGLKVILPLVVIVWGAMYVPLPGIFGSWLSRVVVSVVLTIALLQLAAVVQFFVLPRSDFTAVALLYALLAAGGMIALRNRKTLILPIVSRHDLFASVVALIFVLPFTPVVFGNSAYGITQIGGLQSPDAGHHVDFINTMARQQHLDTTGYPKSFHLAVGFLQTAVLPSAQALSWQANALVFFSHYLLLGAATAFMLYYVCVFWMQKLAVLTVGVWTSLALAGSLGVTVSLLALWPFVELGFLNYFFVVIAVVLAGMCLFDYHQRQTRSLADGVLLVGMLCIFAVSATWPLLLPAMLGSLLLTAVPLKVELRPLLTLLWRTSSIPSALLVAVAFAPLILQVLYPGATGVNAEGALRTYHPLLVLGGLALLLYVLTRSLPAVVKTGLLAVFLPLTVLSVLLVAFQLLATGEVRYFSIKVSLLLELLLVVLGVAALAAGVYQVKRERWRAWLLLPIAPVGLLVVLLSSVADPFKDVRDLFRDYTGQSKPAHYDRDALAYARLGTEGKINHFNSTVLHYDHEHGRFVAHTLLPQWAQTIKYDTADLPAKACHRLIYHNLVYGGASPEEQQALIDKIKECAEVARQNDHPYYIITDDASLPQLQKMLGKRVEYVRS